MPAGRNNSAANEMKGKPSLSPHAAVTVPLSLRANTLHNREIAAGH
jgi:hypothetical protein